MGDVHDLAINLAASAIFVGIGWFGQSLALPTLKGRLRGVPKLDGTKWRRTVDPNGSAQSILTIRQSGTKITATIVRSEKDSVRTFKYFGIINGQQIAFIWENSDSPEAMFGTMFLVLNSKLTTLSGTSVYFRHDSGKVVATERSYEKMH